MKQKSSLNSSKKSLPNLAQNSLSKTVYAASQKLSCVGDAVSSHPLIYLNMGKNNSVICPYCSRNFVLNPESKINLSGH